MEQKTKTKLYTPPFYLVKDGFVIKVADKTTIGRSQGTVVLEEDTLLSSKHCELVPRLMDLYIKDLNSTNGVFVNKQKILPNVETKLSPGDVVKIGSDEYTIFDNEEEVRKLNPPENRRRHPRAKNLYSPKNLVNFFSAPYLFRGIYLVMILGAIASFFLNIHLDMAVPNELQMLFKLYSDQIIYSGVKTVFLVWLISLIHSLLMHLYLNRNPMRKGIGVSLYLFLLLFLVDYAHGPLGGVKRYIVEREYIENLRPQDKAILQLKTALQLRDNITRAYNFTLSKLNPEEQELLKKDYKRLHSKISSEITRVSVKRK